MLWLLDEYWNYALFHFAMICLLEASTAFSRIKSVASLRGMRSASTHVYVLRDGSSNFTNLFYLSIILLISCLLYFHSSSKGVWRTRDSNDLLPGDVFSGIDESQIELLI